MVNDALEQVRVQVAKDNPRDVKVIVNGREVTGCISYTISQGVDDPAPHVMLEVTPIEGLVFEAVETRLWVLSACQSCGFTYRQPLLPITATDHEKLEALLRLIPGILETSPAYQHVQALLRDIRATLDAFQANFGTDSGRRLRRAEIEQGRPTADASSGPAELDSAREAYEDQRRGTEAERRAPASDQADVRSGRPTQRRDRESQNGNSSVGYRPPEKFTIHDNHFDEETLADPEE